MRIFDLACAQPWAITEDALQTILDIAAREQASVEAVEARLGRPLANSHAVTVHDGVATIPVAGPLFRHANLFTQVSGATSIETLAQDLQRALADRNVRGVLLAIDSPGGEVAGVHEFADMIYAARGTKPIVAYVDDYGASAAYWIASAADEVVVSATGKLGSIGVIAAVRDPHTRSAQSIEFVSSQSPNKRPDPTTDEGKGQIQALIDSLADVFVASVARNRAVPVEKVLEDFGKGGLLVGDAAVRAGLADRVGSQEQAAHAARHPAPRSAPATVATQAPTQAPAARRRAAAIGAGDRQPAQAGKGQRTMGNKFGHWFGLGRDARDLARDAGADLPDEAEFATVQDVADDARERARADQIAQFEARQREADAKLDEANRQLFAATARRLQGEAAAFADGLIVGSKILPAEREGLIAALTTAGMDDAAHGAIALATGAQGSRVDQIKAMYTARPAHGLTTEQLAGNAPFAVIGTGAPAATGPDSYDDDKLLSMTPAGRQAAARRKKA